MKNLKKIYYPILAVLLILLLAFSTFSVTLNFTTPYISTSLVKTNATKIAEAGNYDVNDDNSTSDYASDRYQITSAINSMLKNSITTKYKKLYNTNGDEKTLTSAPSSSISDILMGQYVVVDEYDKEVKKYELAPAYYSMRKTIDATDMATIPNAKEKGLIPGMVFQNIVVYVPGTQTKNAFTKTNNANSFAYDEENFGDVAVLVSHYDSQVGDNGYVNSSLTVGSMLALIEEIVNGDKTFANDFLFVFADGGNHNGLGLDYFLNTDRYDNFFANATDRIKSIAVFDNVGEVSTVIVSQAKGTDAISLFATAPCFSQAGSFSGNIAASIIDGKEFSTINGISAIEILGVGNKYDISAKESLTDEKIEKVTSVLGAFADKFGNAKLESVDANATVGYFTFVGIKFWFASYVAYIIGALVIALAGLVAWFIIKKNAIDPKKAGMGSAVSVLSVLATVATLVVLYFVAYLILVTVGAVSIHAIATYLTDNVAILLIALVLSMVLLTVYNQIFKNLFKVKTLSVVRGNAWLVMLFAIVLCFAFPTYSYLFAPLALLQGGVMLVSILLKDKFKTKFGYDIERLLGYGAVSILLLPIVFAETITIYFVSPVIFLPVILALVLVYFQSIIPYALIIKDLLGIQSKTNEEDSKENVVVNKKKVVISKSGIVIASIITVVLYAATIVVSLLSVKTQGLTSAQTHYNSCNAIYNNAFVYEYKNDNGTESKTISIKDIDLYSYMKNNLDDFVWDADKQAYVITDDTQTSLLPVGDKTYKPYYQNNNSKLIKFGKNNTGDEIRFDNKSPLTITIKVKNSSDRINMVRLIPDSSSVTTTVGIDAKKYVEYQVNGEEITLHVPAGVGKNIGVEIFAVSGSDLIPAVDLEIQVESYFVSGNLDKPGSSLAAVVTTNPVMSALSTIYSDSNIIENVYLVFDYNYVGSVSVPSVTE